MILEHDFDKSGAESPGFPLPLPSNFDVILNRVFSLLKLETDQEFPCDV